MHKIAGLVWDVLFIPSNSSMGLVGNILFNFT